MSVSRMKKLTVFVFRRDSDRILRRLMDLRCVEVRAAEDSENALSLRRENTELEIAECDRVLAQLRDALPILQSYTQETRGKCKREYSPRLFYEEGGKEAALKTVEAAFQLQEKLEKAKLVPGRIKTEMLFLRPWRELDRPLSETETRTTRTRFGILPREWSFTDFAQRVEMINGYAELIAEEKNASYTAVTYFKNREEEWEELAADAEWIKVDLPRRPETALQLYDELELKLENSRNEILAIEEELINIADGLDKVEILFDLVSTDRSVAELHRRLAQTESCAVLEGWVPAESLGFVEEALKKFECAYELRDPLEEEEPPILLKNNRFARNFEWVVGMYSYPKYGRFDPTAIMSIFYFVIFGLMFADVGYGLILTVGGFGGAALMNLKPGMKRSFCMFGYCGISAMIMGVLFGGWFGDLPTALMENVLGIPVDSSAGRFFASGLLFNPLDDPLGFMIFSLAVGGIHLVAGMAVNFYMLCRDGKPWEAVCTIVPFWVLFGGLLLLLVNQTLGLIVAAAGALLILVLNGYGIKNPILRLIKGLGGWYGLINYASDLLSYSRILALGLVAAVIAKVVNMITMLGNQGVFGPVVMVVVLIVGHLLNLAINVLGSFVHTSRLQYMEFFGKFYEDGGRPFDPAAPTEEYSESIDKI